MFQSGGLFRPFPVQDGPSLNALGAVMHPGVRGMFVRSTGRADHDPQWLANSGRLFPTVAAALIEARSAKCDVVNVLPGHVETISTADHWADLVAGTKIVGWGTGTERPQITWNAATATILLNVANVNLIGLNLYMAGDPASTTALTVAAPITVSAAGCGFYDCFMHVGVDANQIVTKAITGTNAADYLTFSGCHMYGATAAECTTVLEILGSDFLRMYNTHIQAGTSSTTVGVMRLNATALLGGYVGNCSFVNRKALSVHAVTGVAASAGVCENTNFGILDNATLVGWETKADWMFYRCHTVNLTGETGAATTVVST